MKIKAAFVLLISVCCNSLLVRAEEEIRWTPNEEHQPLPLSNNQREQLLQLEQVIMQSQDPRATLNQAAQANQMDPQELLDLLTRNRSQLEAAGAIPPAGQGTPRGNNVWKKLLSLLIVGFQAMQRHPRSASLLATALVVALLLLWSAPRTGLAISSGRSVLSRGATTVLLPPTSYVEAQLESSARSRLEPRIPGWSKDLPMLAKDDTEWHLNSDYRQAVSCRRTIDAGDFDAEDAADWLQEHAETLLQERKLTEWTNKRLILVTDGGKEATLVVKGLGDWNRYGLLPLRVKEQAHNSLIFTTLPRSHWDGHIRINIDWKDPEIIITSSLVVPKKGCRTISKGLASKVVQGITESVTSSLRTRTRQSLARTQQSKRFQGAAHQRASRRRHSRFSKEQEMEEMATDRRRRWQRSNPNAGSYRPSGDRMKSPNNAVY